MNAVEVIKIARDTLAAMTGLPVDTVSQCKRDGDGWMIEVEMVEMRRIPNSSDVLATYQIRFDSNGDMLGYERTHRYYRAQVKD
ncbi:gas vesicle protein GvpO [Candidatus Oscillochloris fontis]|uniref:gas vesicle protein GvpO n=1 Tax=Candidatus Oscillochloris fontis TaxID=2496868 RepID=UPI00101CCAD7|nr:gas vesicle protein GvpO [Candidatus Oscillochloris fontis]